MTSKVEEVARAIYEGRNGHGCKPWARLPKDHQKPYLFDAHAAIKAMREPNAVMIEAMDDHAGTIAPQYAYEAAIDAALSEEGR